MNFIRMRFDEWKTLLSASLGGKYEGSSFRGIPLAEMDKDDLEKVVWDLLEKNAGLEARIQESEGEKTTKFIRGWQKRYRRAYAALVAGVIFVFLTGVANVFFLLSNW